jgi:hypothetical protein
MPYYEGEPTSPSGIQVLEQPTSIMSEELEKTGWKYPIPDVSDMELRKFLHQSELDLLEGLLPFETEECRYGNGQQRG